MSDIEEQNSESNMEETESDVRNDYDQLCRELNMDTTTGDAAWQSYTDTKHKYTLEGDQIHWLACALYVACRNSSLPTVGHAGATVQGNGVSLTRLLRSSKLSLIEFFNKAQKWADMSNVKPEFRQKIELLERNFAVSNVIFKKYQPIFVGLFKDPANDPPKVKTSRKTKKPPCTPGEVFDFCWVLFVRVKALCPDISDDLVNSYHLLLLCVDHIYSCALMNDRQDLLNEKFTGVVTTTSDNRPCVVDALCSAHDGIIKEVKALREHWWRGKIRKLFDSKVLKGDNETLTGLLEPANFEHNVKSIRKEYESYVLSIGEYDERVFLGNDAEEDIGTPANAGGGNSSKPSTPISTEGLNKQIAQARLIPVTPLSGKNFIREKDQIMTPVSSSTNLVMRLLKLIGRLKAEPSDRLKDLFSSCDKNPMESIVNRVQEMGEIFYTKYTTPNLEHPGSHEPIARKRLSMGQILYFKNLETILLGEKAKNKPISNLLEHDEFHRVLLACCLEIVIFSYNSPSRTFPWILDCFDLKDYHFLKVIEVIIRSEDWLPREVVKHLQIIEEQILESRAWVSDSPLWEAIERDPNGVPVWEDVAVPSSNVGLHHASVPDVTQSPLSHHGRGFYIQSPIAGDRFKSPVPVAMARRQLAFDSQGGSLLSSPIKAGQSILASPSKPVVQSPTKFAIIQPNENVTLDTESSRPKRSDSLGLFFRKVYTCTNIRLEHLCHGLQIGEETFKRKVWTVFEHVLKNFTHLMKDRHLDQILMCCVYIIWKVISIRARNKDDKMFRKIINQYKKQPQAEKHVYECVLIHPKDLLTPATPNKNLSSEEEKPNDLIKFYNEVFFKEMKSYMKNFVDNTDPPLSPLPKVKTHPPPSPIRKVSENHTVFIRPLKNNPSDEVKYNPQSPHPPLCYTFSRSPSKDLKKINDLMAKETERKSSTLVGKRLLADDQAGEQEGQQPPAKRLLLLPAQGTTGVNARLELIIGDRANAAAE